MKNDHIQNVTYLLLNVSRRDEKKTLLANETMKESNLHQNVVLKTSFPLFRPMSPHCGVGMYMCAHVCVPKRCESRIPEVYAKSI